MNLKNNENTGFNKEDFYYKLVKKIIIYIVK